jgi:hypothetical protein
MNTAVLLLNNLNDIKKHVEDIEPFGAGILF